MVSVLPLTAIAWHPSNCVSLAIPGEGCSGARLQHHTANTLHRCHGVKTDPDSLDSLAITNQLHEQGPGVRFQDYRRDIEPSAERVGVCYVLSIAVGTPFPFRLSPSQARHLHDDSALFYVQDAAQEANLRYSRAYSLVTSTPHYQRVVLATWHGLVLIAQERVANSSSGSPLVLYICTNTL